MTSTQDATSGESGWSALDITSAARGRKRGSRACLRCRIRKVRCDVTQHGMPCTNCRIDAQPCVIQKRSRKHPLLTDSSVHTLPLNGQPLPQNDFALQSADTRQSASYAEHELSHPRGTSATDLGHLSQYDGEGGERWQLQQQNQLAETSPSTMNLAVSTTVGLSAASDAHVDTSRLAELGAGQTTSSASTTSPRCSGGGMQAVADMGRPTQPRSRDHVMSVCYPFLETDFISSIPPEDFQYLDHIGCLRMPQRIHLDELVRAYFLYVHPHLPLIDEGKFWESYLSSQPGARSASRMSLFVFQAMLLVACSFVSSSTIQGLGFSSVRMARTSYYRQAKALYDFNIEGGNLAKAQGALLMTYHVPLNEPQVNSYWLGIAIHLARAEGADRWCCIIRDRTMALGLRRSILIISASFEKIWPLLTEEDLNHETSRSWICNASVKAKLSRSLSSLCKLCVVLTSILQLLYPADGVHAAGHRVDLLKRIYTYTDELNDWHDTMSSKVMANDQDDKPLNIPVLFTNLLTIYFHSTQAALCNYRVMLTINDPTDYSFERLQTKNELQAALRGIALCLRAIIDADMTIYSPISMVAFLALPSICHNMDLSSRPPTQLVSHSASTNIYQDFLRVLQLRYEGTDRALDNMSKLTTDMNLENATSPSIARSITEQRPTGREDLTRLCKTPPARARSGINMVISDPRKYVQMSQTLDFFLSRGRFPTKEDSPLNLPSSPVEVDRLTGSGPMRDSTADRTTDSTMGSHQSQDGASNFPIQAPVGESLWTASPSAPIDSTATAAIPTGNPELPMTLTDDPSAETGINSDDFSFEDFMTDGPFSGIERLQDMLQAYPSWP
ncbi:hypothetical protein EDD37DRAFT_291051 [Exophiala viscosa]|uniref:uncharacterized protein n=1 Tax=Exophiala viscosa TaxID=2486360 RepID=UPI0021923A5F|nr:hypothetical protein EDD37DRAFT_291051 [Exophiala viscosa]